MGEYEDQLGRIAAERQEVGMPVAVERQQKGRDLVPFAFITPNQAVDQNGDDIVVTKSGAVRTVPYDPSEVEATVNLLPETFQTGVGNWGSDNSTRVWIYDRSMTVVPNGSVGSLVAYSSNSSMPSWPVGQVATWSIDFTNDTGVQVNAYCTLRAYSAPSVPISPDINGTSIVVEPYETKRLTVTAVAPATSVFVRLLVCWGRVGGGLFTTSQTVNLKNPQFEWGDHATPYVHPMSNYVYWLGTVTNSPSARLAEHPDRYQEATTNIDTNPVARDVKRSVNAVPGTASSRIDNAGLDHPTAGRIDTATRVTVTANLSETTWMGKTFTVTPAVGDTFSSQVWFRVSKGLIGKDIQYRLRKYGGTSEWSFVLSQIATGEWQYFRNVLNVTTAGGTDMYDYLVFPDAVGNAAYVGEYVDFTATQLELKPYSTPLVDINSPDVTWAGTPFASASSRPTRQDPLRGVGYFIEEGTTNLASNPVVANNTSRWNAIGAGSVLNRVKNPRKPGGWWCEGSHTGNVSVEGIEITTDNISVTAGDMYTATIDVDASATVGSLNQLVRVLLRESSNGEWTEVYINAASLPATVTVTHTIVNTAPTVSMRIRVDRNTGSTGTAHKILATNAQIEKKPYASSLAVGDMGTGYSWSGTPHASASMRSAGFVTTPAYKANYGSTYLRFTRKRPNVANAYILQRGTYGGISDFVGQRIFRDGVSPTGRLMVLMRFGTDPERYLDPVFIPTKEYFKLYWGTDGNSARFVESGTLWLYTTVPLGPWIGDTKPWYIGSFAGGNQLNGEYACLILFNRPLSDAEIAYLDSIPTHALTFENVRRVDFWEPDAT